MKRRSFLSLLGLAPAVPLIAKEAAKAAEPALSEAVRYEPQSLGWSECTMNWSVCLASASFTAVSPFEISLGSPPEGEKR